MTRAERIGYVAAILATSRRASLAVHAAGLDEADAAIVDATGVCMAHRACNQDWKLADAVHVVVDIAGGVGDREACSAPWYEDRLTRYLYPDEMEDDRYDSA